MRWVNLFSGRLSLFLLLYFAFLFILPEAWAAVGSDEWRVARRRISPTSCSSSTSQQQGQQQKQIPRRFAPLDPNEGQGKINGSKEACAERATRGRLGTPISRLADSKSAIQENGGPRGQSTATAKAASLLWMTTKSKDRRAGAVPLPPLPPLLPLPHNRNGNGEGESYA
jgi:hypothetical protein